MVAVYQKEIQLKDSVATLALRTDVVRYLSTVFRVVCNQIRYVEQSLSALLKGNP